MCIRDSRYSYGRRLPGLKFTPSIALSVPLDLPAPVSYTHLYVIALLLVFFLIPSFDIKLTPSDLLGDLLAEQSDGTYKKNYDEHGLSLIHIYRKPTQVDEERILRPTGEGLLRNSAY